MLSNIEKILCTFSGEDYTIIQQSSRKVKGYFFAIGFFVLAILICCFISAIIFTEHLFHNVVADVGTGIIWGYIVTNLYVLLLYTITPSLLPIKERLKSRKKTQSIRVNTSFALRIVLVLLLAIITAQPLNILLLKPNSIAFAYDIKYLLGHSFGAWIVTVIIIGVFLFPIYLKYTIRRLGEFYEKEVEIKKRIIEDDYKQFKNTYKILLEENIERYNKRIQERIESYLFKLKEVNPSFYQQLLENIELEVKNATIDKYEYWSDPPYRTIHKSQINKSLTERDLLKTIYPISD